VSSSLAPTIAVRMAVRKARISFSTFSFKAFLPLSATMSDFQKVWSCLLPTTYVNEGEVLTP